VKEDPAGRGDKQLCPTLLNNSREGLVRFGYSKGNR